MGFNYVNNTFYNSLKPSDFCADLINLNNVIADNSLPLGEREQAIRRTFEYLENHINFGEYFKFAVFSYIDSCKDFSKLYESVQKVKDSLKTYSFFEARELDERLTIPERLNVKTREVEVYYHEEALKKDQFFEAKELDEKMTIPEKLKVKTREVEVYYLEEVLKKDQFWKPCGLSFSVDNPLENYDKLCRIFSHMFPGMRQEIQENHFATADIIVDAFLKKYPELDQEEYHVSLLLVALLVSVKKAIDYMSKTIDFLEKLASVPEISIEKPSNFVHLFLVLERAFLKAIDYQIPTLI